MDFSAAGSVGAQWVGTSLVFGICLLSMRLSAVLALTPVLQAFGMPLTARLLLVIALSAGLALGIPASELPDVGAMSSGAMLFACASELALGATLALGILAAFGAISFAGRLIDVQVGFGIAQVYDPATKRQVSILSSVFDKLGVIVFFLVDGHHALLRGIAYSLSHFPLGRPWSMDAAAAPVIAQVGGLFTLGFALAAPVVVAVLMVELALGVVARNLPQMNMLVIGLPVKIIAGLAAMALWFAAMGDTMGRIYGSIYRSWDAVFATAPVQKGR